MCDRTFHRTYHPEISVLYNGIRHTSESRRQATVKIVVALAVALSIGLMWACVAIGNATQPLLTMGQSATRACLTAAPAKLMVDDSPFTASLPNVGTPKAVIAVPACFYNPQLPKTDAGHYSKYVDVYVMVSNDQLTRLVGPTLHAFNAKAKIEHNYPYPLKGAALKGLVTTDQQKIASTDISSSRVRYWLTDGPMPTEQADTHHGYEYTTGPRDLVTDARFMDAPFTSAVAAYGSDKVATTGK